MSSSKIISNGKINILSLEEGGSGGYFCEMTSKENKTYTAVGVEERLTSVLNCCDYFTIFI